MENRKYGYARVSSKEQNETRQVEELAAFGIDRRNIKVDKISGKTFDRKAYNALVGTEEAEAELRAGDLFVVSSIDRLGRNYSEIRAQWAHITQAIGADIVVLDMPLLNTRQGYDTLDARFVADLVLQLLSYCAEKERLSINSRIRQGIDCMPIVGGRRVSSKTGRPTGRPPAVYPENWQEVYSLWKTDYITAVEAMARLSLKKNTFYKLARQYGA
jgi:DNA invertase Pin-like site-specific DNA recombinase